MSSANDREQFQNQNADPETNLENSLSSPLRLPQTQPAWRLPTIILAIGLTLCFGFLGYQAEIVLPTRSPNLSRTETPFTQAAPSGVGSYLGTMFQNAANPEFRLPEGARPSEFFEQIDPTPGSPGLNSTIKMPEYPKGSLFMQNGDPNQIGMVGTLMQGIKPDAAASLRMLLDRDLREPMIAANRANSDLQRSNVDGSGHAYWVDAASGFTAQDQSDLVQFLLSLDDDPEVLPEVSTAF